MRDPNLHRLPPPLPPVGSENQPFAVVQAQPHGQGFIVCGSCRAMVAAPAQQCWNCHQSLMVSAKSDGMAGCLGIFLGPVGLWYKGHWGAGFAWLVMVILVVLGTAGVGILLAPVFWLGMGIHAYTAKPRL